jgi:hypothetical protein
MTSALIGNLTVICIFFVVMFFVIGVLASVNWIGRKLCIWS